ncbi:MAG: TolB family protein [bacterium]
MSRARTWLLWCVAGALLIFIPFTGRAYLPLPEYTVLQSLRQGDEMDAEGSDTGMSEGEPICVPGHRVTESPGGIHDAEEGAVPEYDSVHHSNGSRRSERRRVFGNPEVKGGETSGATEGVIDGKGAEIGQEPETHSASLEREGNVLGESLSVGEMHALEQVLKPLYVRSLTSIERGHNDSNPVWSPNGAMIAYERSIGERKEIVILRPDGSPVQTIYFQSKDSGDEMDFFFPGVFEEVSYNSGISWSPGGDRFVFMSNGGGGNYDLYLCDLGSAATTRLTEHGGKDGHAQWSPGGGHLAFVSGRSGKADVYLMDIENRYTTRLTQGAKEYLYPQWSPDGRSLVMLYGSNENHDIYLIGDVSRPRETLKPLTTWTYDDLRPTWSPDGKRIAFYSNYNPGNDPRIWCIIVIAADGSDPAEGEGLVAKVAAWDVVPDIERGPAWMPDSTRIIYVKNDRKAYNPLYVTDIEKGTSILLSTDTRMNHDVTCSAEGAVAFRAQVEQWDHVYIARLKE